MVAIDHFTKCVEVKALASIATKKVKDFFYKEVICWFGIPKILISDNNKQFNSKEFQSFCEQLEIE